MTTWAYRVTLGDGRKLVFYLAEDTEGYGYLVQLNDAEYARYADIVDYTYADDSGDGAVPDDTAAPSELAVYIPLTETTAPAPVRLVGVICETPEAYIDDIAAAVGMTAEDFVYTYGDYYIDSELTPDTGSSFWSLIASFLGLAAFVLLVSAASYTAQLNSTLKHLKKGKLLERAESEFHYLEGDRRSDALVSTAFLYGRRQNIVLPLADVLWVYRHDLKLLWAKRTVVELLTYDGRSITLRSWRAGPPSIGIPSFWRQAQAASCRRFRARTARTSSPCEPLAMWRACGKSRKRQKTRRLSAAACWAMPLPGY